MIDDLYSREILRRTTQLMHIGRLDAPQASADRTAKLCGSTIHVDIRMAKDAKNDVITGFAQKIQACALGQAAAAIMSQHVIGATAHEVFGARDALRALLKGEPATFPERFADLAILESVKDYPARHASTLLAPEAICDAISQLQHNN